MRMAGWFMTVMSDEWFSVFVYLAGILEEVGERNV